MTEGGCGSVVANVKVLTCLSSNSFSKSAGSGVLSSPSVTTTCQPSLAHTRALPLPSVSSRSGYAIALNPNSAFVISMLGCVLGFGGYREEALARLQQAMRTRPHDPLTWLWTLWTGMMYSCSRRFDAAMDMYHQVVRLRPATFRAKNTCSRSSSLRADRRSPRGSQARSGGSPRPALSKSAVAQAGG